MNSNDGNAGDTGTIDDLGLGGGDSGGDAGAGGGAGDGGAGDGGDGAGGEGASADFLALFSGDLGDGESASNRDYIAAKGFKDLDGLVKAYRNAERGLHDSGRVKVPGEGASEAEIAEYRAAIGVPEKPEGYERPVFKDKDDNPIPYNTELTDRIFASAHKIGVPKAAAEQLLREEIERQIEEHDTAMQQLQAAANEHVKSWGEDKDNKLAQVNAALKDFGFSKADVQHMRAMPSGPGKFLDAMAKAGANFSEDSLVRGDKTAFGTSPENAQKEIDTMMADPDIAAKMLTAGSPENKRYERLLEAAGAASVDKR